MSGRKKWRALAVPAWGALLLLALLCAGCAASGSRQQEQGSQTETPQEETLPTQPSEPSAAPEEPAPEAPEPEAPVAAPIAEEEASPAVPEAAAADEEPATCTLSISCASLLAQSELCDPDKLELIPEDGWILEPTRIPFDEGESVFQVLQRTCRERKIHMEYEDTPLYNSAYIEGIGNLYEYDGGELSGWMYSVNGWFPNYGCSQYQLQDGDVVCWVYTCDMGSDVGGGTSAEHSDAG